jgi:prephenate dehydratase
MKVAIQGELGSFSHAAAQRLYPAATLVPCSLSAEVFEKVVRRTVNMAVIPIENSLAGPVIDHFDLLLSNDVHVERELNLRIEHCLIAAPGVKLGDIRRVLSHPVALQQCRDFFRAHPSIRPDPFYDTAGSVKYVRSEDLRDAGAIASRTAASQYGARVLQKGIEDDKQNFTRFFVIRKNARILPDANKTSIAFALKNMPGALFRALSVFALRDIDLSKIESRPMRGRPWEYVFYVDYMRGRDEAARNALRHLAEVAEFVKVLGVYPSAT